MIYADTILESRFAQLASSPLEIMQEYYENEISMLNATIEYKNKCSLISESSELQTLQEGFIGGVIDRIKEMIKSFIAWIKKMWNSFMGLFKKKQKTTEEKQKEFKKEIDDIRKDKNLSEEEKMKKAINAAKKSGIKIEKSNSEKYSMTYDWTKVKDAINKCFEVLNQVKSILSRLTFDAMNNPEEINKFMNDIKNSEYNEGYSKAIEFFDSLTKIKKPLNNFDDIDGLEQEQFDGITIAEKHVELKTKSCEKLSNESERRLKDLEKDISDITPENANKVSILYSLMISAMKTSISNGTKFVGSLSSLKYRGTLYI